MKREKNQQIAKKVSKICGIIVCICICLIVLLVSCFGGSKSDNKELTQEQIIVIENGKNAKIYQGMIDNLSEAFQDRTDKLIEELKKETINISNDKDALKELAISKVDVLAEMTTRSEKTLKTQISERGDSDETFQYYSRKLNDIYKDCANQILSLY